MIAQGAFGLGLIVGMLLGVFASMAVVFGRPLYRLWERRMYRARLPRQAPVHVAEAQGYIRVGSVPPRAVTLRPGDGVWVMEDLLEEPRRILPRVECETGHPAAPRRRARWAA